MALNVLSITPSNNSNYIPLDSEIVIEFDQEVDSFTLENGISLYVVTEAAWIGQDAAVLDSKYSDVLDVGNDYSYFKLRYTINGNVVTLKPESGLMPDKKHFVQIVPGSDPERFLSAKTIGNPVYDRVATSTGLIDAASAYVGKVDTTYTVVFSDATHVDVSKDGVYLGVYTVSSDNVIQLDHLSLLVSGSFDAGDSVTIDAFKAVGLETIIKTSFTTTAYTITTPTSKRILSTSDTTAPLSIVGMTPANLSVNNLRANPVIIRFNKSIKPDDDIASKIKITKYNIETGKTKNISYSYVINGNTVKLYLTGVK